MQANLLEAAMETVWHWAGWFQVSYSISESTLCPFWRQNRLCLSSIYKGNYCRCRGPYMYWWVEQMRSNPLSPSEKCSSTHCQQVTALTIRQKPAVFAVKDVSVLLGLRTTSSLTFWGVNAKHFMNTCMSVMYVHCTCLLPAMYILSMLQGSGISFSTLPMCTWGVFFTIWYGTLLQGSFCVSFQQNPPLQKSKSVCLPRCGS